jgi:hypothetical protein
LPAQARLADSLIASHFTKTDSGHGIAVEQPAIVASAIRSIIERVK